MTAAVTVWFVYRTPAYIQCMLSRFPGDVPSCVDPWTHFSDLKNGFARELLTL